MLDVDARDERLPSRVVAVAPVDERYPAVRGLVMGPRRS